jgi:hypothetical protein
MARLPRDGQTKPDPPGAVDAMLGAAAHDGYWLRLVRAPMDDIAWQCVTRLGLDETVQLGRDRVVAHVTLTHRLL